MTIHMIAISKQHYEYLIDLIKSMSKTVQSVLSQEKQQFYKNSCNQFENITNRLMSVYKKVSSTLQSFQTNEVILRQQNSTLHSALQQLKQKFTELQNLNISSRADLSRAINENSQLKQYIKKIKQVRTQEQKINEQLILKVGKYKKNKQQLQKKLNEKQERIRILQQSENDPLRDQLDKELQQLQQLENQQNYDNGQQTIQ